MEQDPELKTQKSFASKTILSNRFSITFSKLTEAPNRVNKNRKLKKMEAVFGEIFLEVLINLLQGQKLPKKKKAKVTKMFRLLRLFLLLKSYNHLLRVTLILALLYLHLKTELIVQPINPCTNM